MNKSQIVTLTGLLFWAELPVKEGQRILQSTPGRKMFTCENSHEHITSDYNLEGGNRVQKPLGNEEPLAGAQ